MSLPFTGGVSLSNIFQTLERQFLFFVNGDRKIWEIRTERTNWATTKTNTRKIDSQQVCIFLQERAEEAWAEYETITYWLPFEAGF